MNKRLILLVLLAFWPCFAHAEVEDLKDGTYKVTGKFIYYPDKDMLVPSGKGNNYGDFKLIIFKPSALEYPGIHELTTATHVVFKVKGRPGKSGVDGEPVLIVEQILEWEGGREPVSGN